MTSCVACQDAEATEPAEYGCLSILYLCADCRYAASRPASETFTLPGDRSDFLDHRAEVLADSDQFGTEEVPADA